MSRARRANATAIAPIDASRGAEVGLPSHNRHPGPARCWASSLSKRDSRTSLYLRRVSVAGKRNSEPRDNSPENACSVSLVSAEIRTRAAEPANSGPFGSSQEISPNVGLPGGPGSCATARRFQQLRLSNWPNGSHGRCAPRGHWEHSLGSASTALLRSI